MDDLRRLHALGIGLSLKCLPIHYNGFSATSIVAMIPEVQTLSYEKY